MKIAINPFVKKDVKVTSRSMKFSWGFFAYEIVLVLALLLCLLVINEDVNNFYADNNFYNELTYVFPILAIAQVCIVTLIMPIITASSISGEIERQTFDILSTTCMTPFSIVFGKVSSAILRILLYVVGSIPIMAVSFVIGGTGWSTLFFYLLAIIMIALFGGAIGIMCSAFFRKSIVAVIMSFIIYFIIFGVSYLPLLIYSIFSYAYNSTLGEGFLIQLFNPLMFFIDFFFTIISGQSVFAELSPTDVGFFSNIFVLGGRFMYFSAICIIALSFLFLALAAWKVNPLHNGTVRRKKKKAN